MLKYLYTVMEDLLAVVTLATMLYVVNERLFGAAGKRSQAIGAAVGLISSAVLAAVRSFTSLVTKTASEWAFYGYAGIALFGLIYGIALLAHTRFLTRLNERPGKAGVGGGIACVAGGALTACLIYDRCRSVLRYPFIFETGGKGLLSAEYALRLSGWVLALLLLLLYACLLGRCLRGYRSLKLPAAAMMLGVLLTVVRNAGRCVGTWASPRGLPKWIPFPVRYSAKLHRAWAVPFYQAATNGNLALTLVLVGLAVLLMLVLFCRSLKITDPYDNPAQRRKLLARARGYRRRAAGVWACALIAVLCVTAVKAYANQVPPPPQRGEYTVADGKVYVNVEDVNDGSLHSFQYGNVRWIVIRKPNSASYGVGLDACDVCGVDKESTYFQRGTQVICRRCDVVMNVNTIGIYGGCNPIPLSYTMETGKLVFSLEEILAGESRFAK